LQSSLSALPFAANIALLNQMMAVNDLEVIAMIGLVLPNGIVGNNAIMMVDLAFDSEREQTSAARDASSFE
jgi:multidrug efflux pump subunit AcrB